MRHYPRCSDLYRWHLRTQVQAGVHQGPDPVKQRFKVGAGSDRSTIISVTSMLHQTWEALKVRAYNDALAGELQPEVDLLQGVMMVVRVRMQGL